jgi:hypothetical protein
VDLKLQDAFLAPNKHDYKRTSPCHIVVKMPRLENKEKNIENCKRKIATNFYKQIHKKYLRLLRRNPKNQESME